MHFFSKFTVLTIIFCTGAALASDSPNPTRIHKQLKGKDYSTKYPFLVGLGIGMAHSAANESLSRLVSAGLENLRDMENAEIDADQQGGEGLSESEIAEMKRLREILEWALPEATPMVTYELAEMATNALEPADREYTTSQEYVFNDKKMIISYKEVCCNDNHKVLLLGRGLGQCIADSAICYAKNEPIKYQVLNITMLQAARLYISDWAPDISISRIKNLFL